MLVLTLACSEHRSLWLDRDINHCSFESHGDVQNPATGDEILRIDYGGSAIDAYAAARAFELGEHFLKHRIGWRKGVRLVHDFANSRISFFAEEGDYFVINAHETLLPNGAPGNSLAIKFGDTIARFDGDALSVAVAPQFGAPDVRNLREFFKNASHDFGLVLHADAEGFAVFKVPDGFCDGLIESFDKARLIARKGGQSSAEFEETKSEAHGGIGVGEHCGFSILVIAMAQDEEAA